MVELLFILISFLVISAFFVISVFLTDFKAGK